MDGECWNNKRYSNRVVLACFCMEKARLENTKNKEEEEVTIDDCCFFFFVLIVFKAIQQMDSSNKMIDSTLCLSQDKKSCDTAAEQSESVVSNILIDTDIYFENTTSSFSMMPDTVRAQGGLHVGRMKFTSGLTRVHLSRSAFYVAFDLHRVSQIISLKVKSDCLTKSQLG